MSSLPATFYHPTSLFVPLSCRPFLAAAETTATESTAAVLTATESTATVLTAAELSTAPSIVDPSPKLLSSFVSAIHAQKKLRDEINTSIDDQISRYIKLRASAPSEVDSVIVYLREYIYEFYPTNPESAEPFFASLKENLTMAPITCRFLISRHGPYFVEYDTILYGWRGRLIMYVHMRDNEKTLKKWEEGVQKSRDLNGFSFDGFKLSKSDEIPDFLRTWWKSDIVPDKKVRDEIEWRIEASHKNSCAPLRSGAISFSKRIDGIAPEFQLIVAAFDQSCYAHLVMHILKSVEAFEPNTDRDTESCVGWAEDDEEDDEENDDEENE